MPPDPAAAHPAPGPGRRPAPGSGRRAAPAPVSGGCIVPPPSPVLTDAPPCRNDPPPSSIAPANHRLPSSRGHQPPPTDTTESSPLRTTVVYSRWVAGSSEIPCRRPLGPPLLDLLAAPPGDVPRQMRLHPAPTLRRAPELQ